MSNISCTITSRSINVVLGGRMRTIPKGHMNFAKIENLLRKINTLDTAPVGWRDVFRSREAAKQSAEKRLYELLDVPVYIEKATAGRVRVTDKGVLFNDAPIHNAVTDQIMKLMHAGQDVGAMANFLDRLMSNPIAGVQDDLYAWIESGDMALTPDGCFLAFKKVGPDYASGHRAPDGSKVFNNIGAIVSMPREEVNTDRNHTCSQGLHFCSFQYLPNFGAGGGALDRVVIVKIAPEDVVAIPTDYNRSKGRTWKYEVIGEVPQEECEHLFKDKPLVAGTLEDPLGDVFFDDDDDDDAGGDFWAGESDPEDRHWSEATGQDEDEGLRLDNTVTPDQLEEHVDQILNERPRIEIGASPGYLFSENAYILGYANGAADLDSGSSPEYTDWNKSDCYDQGYADAYAGRPSLFAQSEEEAEEALPDRPRIDENSNAWMSSQHAYDNGYRSGQEAAQDGASPTWTQATVEDRHDQGYVDGYFGTKAREDAEGDDELNAIRDTPPIGAPETDTYISGYLAGLEKEDVPDDATTDYLDGYEDGLSAILDSEPEIGKKRQVPVYRDGEIIAYREVDE